MISERDVLALKATLSRRSVRPPVADASLVRSAVIAPFLFSNGTPQLLFTQRSLAVAHHKGQVCFPGGIWEEGDGALVNTALREIEEEIGIVKEEVIVLGELDGTSTPTGFHITPFLGLIKPSRDFVPNPEEIEALLLVPFDVLARLPVQRQDTMVSPRYEYEGHVIWGATARIVEQVLRLVLK